VYLVSVRLHLIPVCEQCHGYGSAVIREMHWLFAIVDLTHILFSLQFFKLILMYKRAGYICEPRSAQGQYNAPKLYQTVAEYLKKESTSLSVCVIVSSSNSVRCH
jgi:hypothetical protein